MLLFLGVVIDSNKVKLYPDTTILKINLLITCPVEICLAVSSNRFKLGNFSVIRYNVKIVCLIVVQKLLMQRCLRLQSFHHLLHEVVRQ